MDEDQNTVETPATGDDDFDAAFAQRAAEIASNKPALAEKQTQEDEADANSDGQQPVAAPQQAAQATPAQQQPAQTAQAKPEAVSSSGKTAAELEVLLADAVHRERSNAARISANDRRSNALQAENDALKQRIAALEASSAGPAAGGSNPDDILSQNPELRDAVQSRISDATGDLRRALDAAHARLEQLGGAVAPVVQRQEQDAISAVQAQLDGKFTNRWRADIRTDGFKHWLAAQPQVVQDLYERSVNVDETALVLHQFYTRPGSQVPAQPPAPQPKNQGNPPAPQGADPKDRLRQAAGITPRPGAPTAKPDPNDFEGAFAEAAAKRKTQSQGARQ